MLCPVEYSDPFSWVFTFCKSLSYFGGVRPPDTPNQCSDCSPTAHSGNLLDDGKQYMRHFSTDEKLAGNLSMIILNLMPA